MSKYKNDGLCYCERTTEVEKQVASEGCADDDAAVAALPDKWVPRRGGPILSNYLKKRAQDHERVLQEQSEAAALANSKIDEKIRTLAQELLATVNQNQIDINCVVDQNETGRGPLDVDSRIDALKQVSHLYKSRVEDLAQFKRVALTLERERADGIRTILRDYFQRLISVGNRTPKELLCEFDERMYEANQQLLCNSRAYTELEAKLRAQADESIIRAKSLLNQMSLGIAVSYRRHSARSHTTEKRASQKRSLSAVRARKRSISDPSYKGILNDVEEVEQCVARLVEAYRMAVLKVYTGFSGKLIDLREDLDKKISVLHKFTNFESSDLHQMIERTLLRISSHVNNSIQSAKSVLEITLTSTRNMQKSLFNLGDRLRKTFSILHDAGHLWDAHIMRSAVVQKLTMAAVEDLLTSNDTIELSNEIPFNIALEQMRCSSEPEKLQLQYDNLITMLSRTAEMYLQHSEMEVSRLEEFMVLPTTLANILLAEFDCFLEKYPRSLAQVGSSTGETGFGTPSGGVCNLNSPIPRAILITELQGAALINWKNGFLESFESNVSQVPDELKRQARAWVDERAIALNMRFSLKMMSHSIRVERVRAARDARLAELRFHDARLQSHLEAIYDIVNSLPVEASEFMALDASQLYPLCDWVDKIQTDFDELMSRDPLDPEVKRLKMYSYGPRLIKHRNLFEDSLNAAIDKYKTFIEHTLQAARISNVRFITSLKLFGEGGRYSAAEVTKTSAALMRSADAVETCSNRTFDALNHRRIQLLALADQRISPLQRLVDDFIKPSGKNVGKKPAPAPKKK